MPGGVRVTHNGHSQCSLPGPAVCERIVICSGAVLLKLSQYFICSSKKPLGSAVVHLSKSKDRFLAFVDKQLNIDFTPSIGLRKAL